MTQTPELKPCPFCGSEAYMASDHDPDGYGKFRFMECRKCRARSTGKYHSNGNDCPIFYEEVRALWNTRATLQTSIAELESAISLQAPERIWATYPLSGIREQGTIYGHDIEPYDPEEECPDDWDDPCGCQEYIRKDISDARIAELETSLKRADTLLKVAYTMLKEGDGPLNDILVKYDDAECDWICLCDDIESWVDVSTALQKEGNQ